MTNSVHWVNIIGDSFNHAPANIHNRDEEFYRNFY